MSVVLKRIGVGLAAIFMIYGVFAAGAQLRSAYQGYQEYRIIRNWAVQKINAEIEQQKRRQAQAAVPQTVPPPVTAPTQTPTK